MNNVRANAIPIEVKKHAYRQTQDGIVISFVMHPNDVSPFLATAPLGTRYMAALVELNDDETPKQRAIHALEPEPPAKKGSLAQQSAILCGEPVFARFLEETHPHIIAKDTAQAIREICGVDSRAEFDKDQAAAQRWRSLHSAYGAWKLQ